MKCPGCGAVVEDGSDLCLECGEPMGDTPAARVARGERANVIRPPAELFQTPKPVVAPTKPDAPEVPPTAAKPVAKPPVKKKWREEEPEPRRCPGCGGKTLAVRCPGCGTKLVHDDD
ncbi:MAG: hypothetical protein JWN44_3338 [Myxococcales bacterium]|nr:hypothetical protein [Myxococcales bacterium]